MFVLDKYVASTYDTPDDGGSMNREFLDQLDHEARESRALRKRLSTSYGRFGWRIEKWKKETGSALPHHFWWFVHNCIAHPAIGVVPLRPTFAFHDFTSKKINRE